MTHVPVSMPEFARQFRYHFPDLGPANRFVCPLLSAATGTPRLDPIALDTAIIARHGEYSGSMADFVTGQYGAAATAFVRARM